MGRLSLLTVALLLAAGDVQAQHTMVVKVRNLDLETAAGAALAVQRMNEAARAFCDPVSEALDVTTLKCRRDMALRAAMALKRPNVIARQRPLPDYHLAATGRTALHPSGPAAW